MLHLVGLSTHRNMMHGTYNVKSENNIRHFRWRSKYIRVFYSSTKYFVVPQQAKWTNSPVSMTTVNVYMSLRTICMSTMTQTGRIVVFKWKQWLINALHCYVVRTLLILFKDDTVSGPYEVLMNHNSSSSCWNRCFEIS